jgi:hypothetical protein
MGTMFLDDLKVLKILKILKVQKGSETGTY